jgi:hypothetical protein
MLSILYSSAGRRRAHGKFPKLPLRPSAITLALFSAFLPLSQNAAAQACTNPGSGSITINASCTGAITADTLNVEAVSGVQPVVDGNVTGASAFASNTLTLKGINTNNSNSSNRRYAYITGKIANFGKIIVDYRPDTGSLNGGAAAAPLTVISESASAILNTGANPNEAVELDILCRNPSGSCSTKYFKFVGSIQGTGGLTVDMPGGANVLSCR